MQSAVSDAPLPPRRAPLFLAGALLFVVGPIVYAVQLQIPYLAVPWYLPVLSTLGILLMAFSAWLRRSIWRGVVLAVFTVLCGFQWFFFTALAVTPPYTGPAQVGSRVPDFTTKLADGAAFASADLQDGKRRVLLFFRGRW